MSTILLFSLIILLVLIVLGVAILNKIDRKCEILSKQNMDILMKTNRLLNIGITHLEQNYEMSEKDGH